MEEKLTVGVRNHTTPMPCLIFHSPEYTSPAMKHNTSHKWEMTETHKLY